MLQESDEETKDTKSSTCDEVEAEITVERIPEDLQEKRESVAKDEKSAEEETTVKGS